MAVRKLAAIALHRHETLRRRAAKCGMTQSQIAKLAGYTQACISRWMSGKLMASNNFLDTMQEVLDKAKEANQ